MPSTRNAQTRDRATRSLPHSATEFRYKWAETLRVVFEGTASVSGSDFFRSLVDHLATALEVRMAFVTECTDAARTRVRTIFLVDRGEYQENIEYDLSGTPWTPRTAAINLAAALEQPKAVDPDFGGVVRNFILARNAARRLPAEFLDYRAYRIALLTERTTAP